MTDMGELKARVKKMLKRATPDEPVCIGVDSASEHEYVTRKLFPADAHRMVVYVKVDRKLTEDEREEREAKIIEWWKKPKPAYTPKRRRK